MLSAKHDMVKTQHTSCNKYSNQVGGEREKNAILTIQLKWNVFMKLI